MKLNKDQIEELKQELQELTTQRDQLRQQAQDQLTAMSGAIGYMSRVIQENEEEVEEEQE